MCIIWKTIYICCKFRKLREKVHTLCGEIFTLDGKITPICWKVYIMRKFGNYGRYYNPHCLLFRLLILTTWFLSNFRYLVSCSFNWVPSVSQVYRAAYKLVKWAAQGGPIKPPMNWANWPKKVEFLWPIHYGLLDHDSFNERKKKST